MSTINPVSGENSGNPVDGSTIVNPATSPQTQEVTSQDTLVTSSTPSQTAPFTSPNAPALPLPNPPSISQFISSIASSTVQFEKQIIQTAQADLKQRQLNQSSAIQALNIQQMFAQRQKAETAAVQTTATQMANLNQTLQNMQSGVTNEQSAIQNLNSGDAEEQQQAANQIANYNQYIQTIQSLGAVPGANGNYTLPSGNPATIAAFNQATQIYQQQVASFNAYVNQRSQEVATYNEDTSNYNEQANQNNQQISSLINTYQLSDILTKNNIPLSGQSQTPADEDTTAFTTNDDPVSISGNLPATVYTAPPPTWVYGSSQQPFSANAVSSPQLSQSQLQTIQNGIKSYLEKTTVDPLNVSQQLLNNLAYLQMLNIYEPVPNTTPDPLLNRKSFQLLILPDAYKSQTQPVSTQNASGMGLLAVQAAGLGNPNIQGILGQATFSYALNSFKQSTQTKKADQVSAQKKADQSKDQQTLANQLLVLNASLLANQSLNALVPSLQPISNLINSLPADSPAFSLLFSVSLANRIQESIGSGAISSAIQTFLSGLPESANLSSDQNTALTNALTPAVNLSLLLTSTKLLSANLGLANLPSQLLSSFVSPDAANSIIAQGSQENQQSQNTLNTQLQNAFIQQGQSADKAQFLAKVGTDFVSQGLLSPSATTISKDNIQTSLLTNSVTASLLLNQGSLSLTQAGQIADQAVNQTLNEGPFNSLSQFTSALETNLKNVGSVKNASSIALNAVVLPNSSTSASTLPTSLSQLQLSNLVENQALQLLTPQLGPELSQQITAALTNTLFGTPNPSAATVADVQSPTSLVNSIQNQVQTLKTQQQTQHTDAIASSFKDFMQDNVEVSSFLQKLMDPANLLVYSASTGIMYSGISQAPNLKNWTRGTDISV